MELLTILKLFDHIWLTVDASPVKATFFIKGDSKNIVAQFYSFKLKDHQLKWLPWELEALAIAAAVNHFTHYAHESECQKVFTFLSTLTSHHVSIIHLPGTSSGKRLHYNTIQYNTIQYNNDLFSLYDLQATIFQKKRYNNE